MWEIKHLTGKLQSTALRKMNNKQSSFWKSDLKIHSFNKLTQDLDGQWSMQWWPDRRVQICKWRLEWCNCFVGNICHVLWSEGKSTLIPGACGQGLYFNNTWWNILHKWPNRHLQVHKQQNPEIHFSMKVWKFSTKGKGQFYYGSLG